MQAPQGADRLPLAGLHVFISYPRGGHAHTWAERVADDLRSRSALPFRDEREIREGEANWLQCLVDALVRADVLLCIVGHDSAACRWQQRELIKADELRLPVVPFRVDAVPMPFSINERQPVELGRGTPEDALARLAAAVQAAAAARAPRANSAPVASAMTDRATELAYLNGLIHGTLSTHEDRYVPVAGEARRAPTLERSLKGLRLDAHSLLQTFKLPGDAEQHEPPVPYADVLDAYLALPQKRIRRLAVLGEPGAGKSFSLERVAVHHARAALRDAAAPLPLLVQLGLWTRADEKLQPFIERQLGPLGRSFAGLRDARRIVLLLDGLNEIPPGQRQLKAKQVREMAEDERFAAVLVSCRERDFHDDFVLPVDRLTLQPLTPPQVHRFLHRAYRLDRGEPEGATFAEARFWQLAGGPEVERVWQRWREHGASFELFWSAEEIPREKPDVYKHTTGDQDRVWQQVRFGRRSLLALAANPYLLTVMALLPTLPSNRAALFEGFLVHLHEREQRAREMRHDAANVPGQEGWLAALSELAEAMQHAQPAADGGDASAAAEQAPAPQSPRVGAGTSLARPTWPASLSPQLLQFSIDASVLQRAGDDLRFTHQLLQESLAGRVLLQACTEDRRLATELWPPQRWWQRNGWEVVAELAAESCTGDPARLTQFIAWLAAAQPEAAALAWRRAGAAPQPRPTFQAIAAQWAPLLTDAKRQPPPAARAAIGRALAAFDIDRRRGAGLGAGGLPDIDWVPIPNTAPFVYQGRPHPPLPAFDIARYPVTHCQYQAFIDAGGYEQGAPWWQGLDERPAAPAEPRWRDGNTPRDTVSWYEATAFCRWLSTVGRGPIHLPTEQQWERVASGTRGREFPWGKGYHAGRANCNEPASEVKGGTYLQRTTAVGIYPWPSEDGVHDLAGNVWEWTDSWYDDKQASRVLRGGSWGNLARNLRASFRFVDLPDYRSLNIGFRVCRASPIEPPVAGALNAGPL